MATVQMNNFGSLSLISFNNIIPKPTMISSSAKISPWINHSSFWGQNYKLQTTHFHKGKSPLQHNIMRAEKMIAITARAPNGDGLTFPTFNGKTFSLTNDFKELQVGKSVMYYKKLLPYYGQGQSHPIINQKVTIRYTIYDQKHKVKGSMDDVTAHDLVIGTKHDLGTGLDFGIRELRVDEQAIFVIPKKLWPAKMRGGIFNRDPDEYIVCYVTLNKIY
ncbi:uncharacterized protein LOC115721045 isoform X3 [Cannabis sativa]|uniref:uncharacterized protein LOC115721045 isoform X3 n=1 Tax=Cannabis sativa TaxID=3483 RepID=UPI0029C9E4B3|nr:uncharacterized protein LOC115721045 isoform X3 [Cannabis sativa]